MKNPLTQRHHSEVVEDRIRHRLVSQETIVERDCLAFDPEKFQRQRRTVGPVDPSNLTSRSLDAAQHWTRIAKA